MFYNTDNNYWTFTWRPATRSKDSGFRKTEGHTDESQRLY